MINLDLLFAMGSSQQLYEVMLELVAVVVDVLLGIFAYESHLIIVRFGLAMHLESVFVTALLLAYLRMNDQSRWRLLDKRCNSGSPDNTIASVAALST